MYVRFDFIAPQKRMMAAWFRAHAAALLKEVQVTNTLKRIPMPNDALIVNIMKKRMWEMATQTASGSMAFVYEDPPAKKQRALGKDAFDNIVIGKISIALGGKVPRNCGRSGPASSSKAGTKSNATTTMAI